MCFCACVLSACLYPCVFLYDFETDIMGLVGKKVDEDFATSLLECEMSNVAASEHKDHSQIKLY